MFWYSFLGSPKSQEYAEDMFLFCIAFEPDRIVKNGSILKTWNIYMHLWEDLEENERIQKTTRKEKKNPALSVFFTAFA